MIIHGLATSTYVFLGDWAAAIDNGGRMLELSQQTGDKLYQVLSCGMLSWAHSYLSHLEEAQSLNARRLALAQAMGGRLMLNDWFDAVSTEIDYRAGRFAEAYAGAQQVAEQSRAGQLPMSLGVALRSCGLAHWRLHPEKRADAEKLLEASLEALQGGGLAAEIARTHSFWGEACAVARDSTGAKMHLETAAKLLASFEGATAG
jgi:hypothetical protein